MRKSRIRTVAPKVRLGMLANIVGVLCSTASTYVLFIAFSFRSAPEALGQFALWSGAVAIVLQFIDGVSAQRIAQGYTELSSLSHVRHGSVNYLNGGRFVIVLVAGIGGGLLVQLFDSAVAVGLATMLVGQGGYALCVSTRVFDAPTYLLRLQVVNSAVYCLMAAGVISLPSNLSAGSLLTISGVAAMLASLPFIVLDCVERGRMNLSLREEVRLLYLSHSWRQLGSLAAYQAVNACGTAVDTLLTAIGGLRTAAEYQVIRRPMLALSSLNVALGQRSLNKYARGSTIGWRRSMLVLLPVLVVWPALGVAGLVIVRWITPDDYGVSYVGGVLLAASFAVGAFLQLTGTIVLVRKRTTALFLAALGRIAVLVVVALLTVPQLGVVGIGIALLCANVALMAAHVGVLVSSDKQMGSEEKVVAT